MHSTKDAYAAMAEHFGLSEEDLQEMLPSGKQTTCKNRVAWARVYLSKALLLESPKRGFFRITERGQELLKSNPTDLRVKHLKQYPEFVDFHTVGNKQDRAGETAGDEERTTTPEEIFENAYQELRRNLANELLTHISENSPEFVEHLVVKLLVKMGYGGSIKDAGQYVSTIDPKIVLIDGNRLVDLMIDHNLGVSIVDAYEIKKIDSDFFFEE